jgi:hypothetical protein
MDGRITKHQVKEAYERMKRQAQFESGASYSGDWNMIPRLEFHDLEFITVRLAEDYCQEKAEKWQYAVVVRTEDKWVIGGWAAS